MDTNASARPAPQAARPTKIDAPARMDGVVQSVYGTPDVLTVERVAVPALTDRSVLLRVRAAAVNPADWAILQGIPYVLRAVYGLTQPRSRIRGSDVAGVVQAVGDAVSAFEPGDEVFGWCDGAFAEYAAATEATLAPKPAGLDFEQAAAVPMAGITALQALRDQAKLAAGQSLLINGASGGIGTFAVQIARVFGAEVTGVCSARNQDLVRSIGAHHVIDYAQEDFTRSSARYDVILDNVGNHTLAACRRALAPTGVLIPNSMAGNRWFASIGRVFAALATSPFVGQHLRPFFSVPKKADLLALAELLESGAISPVLDSTHPLSDTPAAIARVGGGHARGKVVITV